MGRDGVHQHAGGIGRLATRHVNAHAVQRRDLLAQQRAVFVAVAPAFAVGLLLRLVVAAHAARGRFQGLALLGGQALEGRLEFVLFKLQRSHALNLQAIKAGGVLQHSRIAALLHIGQDVCHTLLDGCIRIGRPMQALRKIMLKSGTGS
ncbi:hypothetical protein D3C72_1296210 [compost metagenome]